MDFQLPPRIYNENGEKRRVGFELEFGGLPLEHAAQILMLLFGGSLHRENEFEFHLDTTLGRFVLEADSTFLKEGKHEKYFKLIGLDEAVAGLAGKLIPFEVATPPLPIDNLTAVERIRSEFQQHSAKGTKSSVFMAFGMQFNPEVPAKDAQTILSYLKAFFLLYDWLYEVSDISIARRVAPFIHEFSEDYVGLVLNSRYQPDMNGLIDDYLKYNPTRNRPLDMLPLFAQIDPDRVFSAPVEKELVKPRPTFHYRLPNSLVDDPNWSIAGDWNKWVEIERLANEPARIREMADDYFRTKDETLIFTRAKWVEKTRHWLHEHF